MLDLKASDLLDPRGRADRKGLAVFAAVLVGAQAGVYGAMTAMHVDVLSGPAWVFHALFFWLGIVAMAKRLHDLGRSAWCVAGAIIAMMVWTLVLAVSVAFTYGEDALMPGSIAFFLATAGTLLPLFCAMLWLHFAKGIADANRFGSVPGPSGFSRARVRDACSAGPVRGLAGSLS